ncbi:aldehyde dehydrogenase family-domain-containing protein [Baffinella frigidus]|nr:aldehyde dehydrogenase family-domain-containing protein [Cryptophyta sp. CCMP2293]
MSAACVVVLVGSASALLAPLVEKARALKVGRGADETTEVGPMISPEAKTRALKIVFDSVASGAVLALDGTGVVVPGYEQGNFIGPVVLTGVTTSMQCYTEEIFAPVLCIMTVATLDEAISLVNANSMGNGVALFPASGGAFRRFTEWNGVALFTASGGAARKFSHEIEGYLAYKEAPPPRTLQ